MSTASITQLPSGSWHTRVYSHTDATGKKIYRSITAPTKTEVKRLMAEFLASRPQLVSINDVPFSTAVNNFISSRSHVNSPKTMITYRQYAASYFTAINKRPVSSITVSDAQTLVDTLSSTLAPKTVLNVFRFFKSVVTSVVKTDFDAVKLPQRKPVEIEIPTDAEISRMLSAVRGTEAELPLTIAAMCGMRRGEICALTWDDVNLESGTISINKSLGQTPEDGYQIKSPKSYSGNRTIHAPARVVELLRINKKDQGTVTSLNPDQLYKSFQRALTVSGVKHYKLHALRHYCCSVMLMLNIPKNNIASYLGHQSTDMIDRVYGHIMRDKSTTFDALYSSHFDKI